MNAYYTEICSEVVHLSIADKIIILKIIKKHNPHVQLHKCADGTRVTLNQLTDESVKMIYEYMRKELNLPALQLDLT